MRVSTADFYRTQLNALLGKQQQITELQTQLATGERIQRSSDDPINATKIKAIDAYTAQLESYQNNLDDMTRRIDLLESSAQGMLDVLRRVKELVTSGLNGTLNNNDRKNIADELEAKFTDLMRIANTQDTLGEYIFSGYKGGIKPFVETGGVVNYQGDQGQRLIQISTEVSLVYTESGFDVFEDVREGNGFFIADDGPTTNTGTGVISSGSVTSSAYVPDTYTINFVTNGSGNLGYTVTGAASGQVIPALPGVIPADAPDYVDGESITFNSVEFAITGQPNVGDDFQIQPSGSQNIFTTVRNIINIMRTDVLNDVELAEFYNSMQSQTASLEQGFERVVSYLVDIGMRGNIVENEKALNEGLVSDNEIARSLIADIDYSEAITLLNQELLALQVSQQSYVKIQELSLFNMIF